MEMEWELRKAAQVLVDQMLNVQPEEHVLIYADTATNRRVVESTAAAVHITGGQAGVYLYETRPEVLIEPPRPLAAAMKASDVVVEFAKRPAFWSKAWDTALEAGSRNICLTGMTTNMMIRCIGKVDQIKMAELGDILLELTKASNKMEITSPAGTNLVCELGTRPVYHNSGIISKPGESTFLGGQVSWAPIEESINGTLVFDGAISPPQEIRLIDTPIKLTIERGRIMKIEGGSEARTLEEWLKSFNDPNMFMLAHYAYGFNPGARLTGDILEDERIFGGVEMGFGTQRAKFKGTIGTAPGHTDGIVVNPTVILDGTVMEKDGKYVHPKLAAIAKELTD